MFQRYLNDRAKWFVTRADGYSTLRILHSASSSRYVSPKRLRGLTKLGAICALLIVSGRAPLPLDPSIFQFLIHDKNFASLHEAFVTEWHPQIKLSLKDWNEAGPTGDLTPFRGLLASYLDVDDASVSSQHLDSILTGHLFPDLLLSGARRGSTHGSRCRHSIHNYFWTSISKTSRMGGLRARIFHAVSQRPVNS